MIDNVRLSQAAKGQLLGLKRRTGIKNWNTLCRWALAVSLRDESMPLVREVVTDSNIEMSWRTFAGQYEQIYLALLQMRTAADGLDSADARDVAHTLKIHLHRGIGRLAEMNLSSIADLTCLALEAAPGLARPVSGDGAA